jgi:hypothetical protein
MHVRMMYADSAFLMVQVKREGLPFHDFGLVPVQSAKRHCAGLQADTGGPGQLTAEMITEFETYKREFSNETVDHTFSQALDLGTYISNSSWLCILSMFADHGLSLMCRGPGAWFQAGHVLISGRLEEGRHTCKAGQEAMGL